VVCRPRRNAAYQVLKDAEAIGSFTIRYGTIAAVAVTEYELEDMADLPFIKYV
jgi:hypothetical protein